VKHSEALIGFGQVRHVRRRPALHAFHYGAYFLMLPMRSIQKQKDTKDEKETGRNALPINRAGWLSFHDADHGDGRLPDQGGALAWLSELLDKEGIHDVEGEIWLQTFPRVLGYTFKPVSFWYCHRADNSLAAIVAEVHNTFGERHSYLLDAPRWGHTEVASKVFHVSPFCEVKGDYQFRFMRTHLNGQERLVARVDHFDEDGPLIETSMSGSLIPASAKALRRALWTYPLFTFAVVARIHWHALLLWLKRVPFFTKPVPPESFVTRGHAPSIASSKSSGT
jgi:DUF1365 family protein